MIEAIFGAEIDYKGNVSITRLEVLKEGPKTITTKRICGALGYRAVHRKDFHPIFLTAKEALMALIERIEARIEAQETSLKEEKKSLIKTQKILKEMEKKNENSETNG